jgi:DNA-directed RNA polymerase II subunit RPB2
MVDDKINYRANDGGKFGATRQPVKGRSSHGGLRVGEMERDALIAHGMSSFVRESFMQRSDGWSMCVEEGSGRVARANRRRDAYWPMDPDGNSGATAVIEVPYSWKTFCQEMESMGVTPLLRTVPRGGTSGAS